jgi:hypothetical protein
MFVFPTCEAEYTVCEHIMQGAAVAEIWQESENQAGKVCCGLCAKISQALSFHQKAGNA